MPCHFRTTILFYLFVIPCFVSVIADEDSSFFSGTRQMGSDDLQAYKDYCTLAECTHDADSIILYSELALAIAHKLSINPARALILKGNGYQLSGRITLAVENYTEAAKADIDFNNLIGLGTAYTSLAGAYISQQNHNNAKFYLNRAIAIFRKENDSARLASALHNLGYEHYLTRQYDSALILFANSAEVYSKLKYDAGIAYCIGNSGLVYSKLNKLNKAQKSLLEAINMLEKIDDDRAVGDFSNEYAYVLQRKGEIQGAIQNAHKSLGIAKRNDITELKRDAAYRLSQIYQQIHKYDSAFHYLLVYYAFSDSVRNIESIQKTADLRTEFEVAQKQAEVDILQKNKTMQRFVILSLIAVVMLAATFIIIIYISLKRNRRLTRILEERRKQLERQSYELKELNRVKDRFFSIISHDLRSPITSLGGISYLIKESLERNNKQLLNQAAEYIDQSVISLTGLLENLLNWALSQQGKFPFKDEIIDLEKIINEVIKAFASVTLSKNQQIHLKLEKELFVRGDRNSMMTILRNLISNALKFTEKGGDITVTAHKQTDGMAVIQVEDTGIGIPEEKIPDLFKLHEDKSSRGTENEKGIGLGLNLVHEFVNLNKGTVNVESTVGKGSRFILRFPLSGN